MIIIVVQFLYDLQQMLHKEQSNHPIKEIKINITDEIKT
mgnify:CR=1 FL=1